MINHWAKDGADFNTNVERLRKSIGECDQSRLSDEEKRVVSSLARLQNRDVTLDMLGKLEAIARKLHGIKSSPRRK